MSGVAVTGALGWLGSRLVEVLWHGLPDGPEGLGGDPRRPLRLLIEPHQRDAAARRWRDPPVPERCAAVVGDLRDPSSLGALFAGERIDTVVHCAGLVHPARVKQLFEVNVDGTRHLLAAACEARVKRFIHISSSSPLGCNPRPGHRFDDCSPYHPYMGYGRSKMAAELLVRQAGRRGDLETVILRPPWFYGPRQPPRQTAFFTLVRRGRAPLVGDGTNRRSMTYLDNLCQAVLLAERAGAAKGGTYWISDREAYPMREVLDTVERVLERDFGVAVAHRRLRLPAWSGTLATWLDRALQAVGLYHPKIHVLGELGKTIAGSIAQAEKELGYAPRVALEEGLRRSIAWLVAEGIAF